MGAGAIRRSRFVGLNPPPFLPVQIRRAGDATPEGAAHTFSGVRSDCRATPGNERDAVAAGLLSQVAEEHGMQVWQLMSSDLTTLDADGTLDAADDLMKLKRIRHLPVLQDERLVGLVTQRDLFLAGVSSVLNFRQTAEKEWLGRIRIREVMTRDLITVAPDTYIEEAAGRMLEHRIGCLPVMAAGKLIGLLSVRDCLRYLQRILSIPEVKRCIMEKEKPVEGS
jgi:CBS domain-containing protein